MNPADGPSRRPDYLSQAQEIPSLVQKDLLASNLVGADSDLPKAARLEPLCEIAKCQLCEAVRAESNSHLPKAEEWCGAPRPRPDWLDRSEFTLSKTGWLQAASRQPAKVQPCKARPRLDKPDRLEATYQLPEAVLYNTARAARRVYALSPLGARG